ncbi:hypothetical protein [Bacillus thuringiensis]|uniref:Uncharacterized protein n=1 Tax=Bacillus thuringiensis TaxID=1428 RepID=A0A9X6TH98_BACTU|nr:hypothetical protein [Bacillus thuringiensis]PEA86353.1 hypothetical protein CON71_30440 [Bacillus thuringiensis]
MKKIVGENIRMYLEATGRTHQWVMDKGGIPKATFYKLLKGEGDLTKGIEKINELFGIKDDFYFYNSEFKPPLKLEDKLKRSDIRNFVAANYVTVEGEETEFKNTLDTLDDFIRMIELLKPYNNLNRNDFI